MNIIICWGRVESVHCQEPANFRHFYTMLMCSHCDWSQITDCEMQINVFTFAIYQFDSSSELFLCYLSGRIVVDFLIPREIISHHGIDCICEVLCSSTITNVNYIRHAILDETLKIEYYTPTTEQIKMMSHHNTSNLSSLSRLHWKTNKTPSHC